MLQFVSTLRELQCTLQSINILEGCRDIKDLFFWKWRKMHSQRNKAKCVQSKQNEPWDRPERNKEYKISWRFHSKTWAIREHKRCMDFVPASCPWNLLFLFKRTRGLAPSIHLNVFSESFVLETIVKETSRGMLKIPRSPIQWEFDKKGEYTGRGFWKGNPFFSSWEKGLKLTDSWERTGISALWPEEQMLGLEQQLAGSWRQGGIGPERGLARIETKGQMVVDFHSGTRKKKTAWP